MSQALALATYIQAAYINDALTLALVLALILIPMGLYILWHLRTPKTTPALVVEVVKETRYLHCPGGHIGLHQGDGEVWYRASNDQHITYLATPIPDHDALWISTYLAEKLGVSPLDRMEVEKFLAPVIK